MLIMLICLTDILFYYNIECQHNIEYNIDNGNKYRYCMVVFTLVTSLRDVNQYT